MASLGAFLNLQRRPTPGSLRSFLDVEIPVEQEVNILAGAAEERQKQDEAGPNLRPANPMQSILEQEKVGAFNALQNIPISPLASAVELASPGAYDAMTAPVEGANPEVPNMLAALDQMSLGGLIDTPVAAGLLRTKAPSLKPPTPARLRGRPAGSLGELATAEPFYSQARTVLEDPKTQGTQTGEAWIKFLTDPKRGVKSEEMQYTGLGDFLKGKGGQRVTRDEIQSHLDANEIEIKEVVKGARNVNPQEIQRADEEMRRTGIVMRQNRTPENVEAFNAAVERYENLKLDYTGDRRETKFSQYTLPGAENYREVLLTIPDMAYRRGAGTPKDAIPNPGDGGGWLVRNERGEPYAVRYAGTAEEALQQARDRGPTEAAYEGRERPTGGTFQSGHWDEPNVLAHLRLSDRTDADGKRTLLVEEIQSDWAQKGRKEGFRSSDTELPKGWSVAPQTGGEGWGNLKGFVVKDDAGKTIAVGESESAAIANARRSDFGDQMANLMGAEKKGDARVPTAPFVTDTGKWTALSLKRVLKMAADGGYDRIGIVPGVEQAKRYDLSKQIDELKWYRDGDKYRVTAMKGGSPVIQKGSLTPNELSETVGKELADKIVAGAAEEQHGAFSGLDLAVGGEGMKGYYDKIVPDTLNKLAKEYGVKVNLEGGRVGDSSVRTLDQINADMDANVEEMMRLGHTGERSEALEEKQRKFQEEYNRAKDGEGLTPIHTLDVPEPMKKQIKAKGFPLYSKAGTIGSLIGAQNA